ncbi:MAG: M20 family metallopeptidase [Planctomycetes bacterium]|nr:M20 family metallopeptidase [Planctomycetota bacterium]MBU1517416.1 M20 family metallopeptidase [Planctomycetota bacterium]MBU2457776.1 M20 family metallopeptidase [Planctomycetota bacterium]MBU2597001.1 M20 family metallopeptidase [Planctomycetota bacterium]
MKELLKKLVQAKSTPDVGELKCAKVLADFFSSKGIKPKLDIWNKNRANITTALKSTGKKPALLFVSHLDVVPADSASAFKPVERSGKIFGRGACDMKAGMASAATAMAEILRSKVKLQGDIIFAATAGEETDSAGVKRFIKTHKNKFKLCGIIVPEPTNFDLVTAHRGLLWVKIITKGKSAHSSMPQLGINAIDSMRLFLSELADYKIPGTNKLLGKASISVNKIIGGKAGNIVPDSCSAQIDIRTIPSQNAKQIVAGINKILTRLSKRNPRFRAELKVLRDSGSLQTDEKCRFVKHTKQLLKKTSRAVPFTTDAPFLTSLKAPIVIFGPGKPQMCHKPDEHIEIKDLKKAVEFYKKMILHFLA